MKAYIKSHMNFLLIIFLYCAIFAWMSVPFTTTDNTMFRKQVMFIDSLQEHIVADAGSSETLATASIAH